MLEIPILGKIDPNTAGVSALLWVVVIAIIIFVFRYWWPHYVKERWPRMQAQKELQMAGEIEIEKHRNDALTAINENLVRLTTLMEANIRILEGHDRYTKEIWQDITTAYAGWMAKGGVSITDNTGK